MLNLKKISRRTFTLVATAAISSGATYFFCQSDYTDERDELNDKIRLLQESERKAVVTQRISEQMEDIAYQSKALADSARDKAKIEQGKAEEQAQRAEAERQNALVAKSKADEAEKQAKKQALTAQYERLIAETEKAKAETEKAKADTLRYISLGRSLAQTSIAQYNIQELDLARLLAYSAFIFTREYGGSPYQQEVFTSLLYSANNARNRIASYKGNVRALECVNHSGNLGDKDILIATDYGEIGLLTPRNTTGSMSFEGFENTLLFSNNDYLFSDMCIIDSMAYILDVEGRMVAVNINDITTRSVPSSEFETYSIASTMRPAEKWTHLLAKKNGQIIAVGEHQIVWFNPKNHAIIREQYIDDHISEAGIGDGKLLIFTDNEKYYTFKEGVPTEWPFEFTKQCNITAYYYLKDKHLHVIGTNIGSILLYDDLGYLKYTLTGHTAPVTHIESGGDWCLVTSSYDKTVRVWDINSLGDFVIPLEIKVPAWPLIFDIDSKVASIRIGLSDGGVETIRYSAEVNAGSVQRHLNRDFTPAEWQYYIGSDVPYRKLK